MDMDIWGGENLGQLEFFLFINTNCYKLWRKVKEIPGQLPGQLWVINDCRFWKPSYQPLQTVLKVVKNKILKNPSITVCKCWPFLYYYTSQNFALKHCLLYLCVGLTACIPSGRGSLLQPVKKAVSPCSMPLGTERHLPLNNRNFILMM